MSKLYYTTSSCGAASFIAAVAAGIHIDAEQVDIKTHLTASGADYYTINPKGNVPCLVTEDGTVLNEGAAVLQYIADQVQLIFYHSQRLNFCCSSDISYIANRLLVRSLVNMALLKDT